MLLFAKFDKMNPDEIEDWYSEEQEKIFSKYLETVDNKESEKEYKEEMKELREKYSEKYEKALQPKKEGKYSKIVKKVTDKFRKQ